MILEYLKNEKQYNFILQDHVVLNSEHDSWRELPVYIEDTQEMLSGR